jgi:chromosome segregation ATPase
MADIAEVKKELDTLKRELLATKRSTDALVSELAENKGNLSAYEKEREKLYAKAREKNADPKNIAKDIETRAATLKEETAAAKRKLEAIKVATPEGEEGW